MSESLPRTEHVYDFAAIKVGDEIAYVGARVHRGRGYPQPTRNNWLRVSRIDQHGAHGFKLHPTEWEHEVEFVVVNRQIADNGVVRRRGAVN